MSDNTTTTSTEQQQPRAITTTTRKRLSPPSSAATANAKKMCEMHSFTTSRLYKGGWSTFFLQNKVLFKTTSPVRFFKCASDDNSFGVVGFSSADVARLIMLQASLMEDYKDGLTKTANLFTHDGILFLKFNKATQVFDAQRSLMAKEDLPKTLSACMLAINLIGLKEKDGVAKPMLQVVQLLIKQSEGEPTPGECLFSSDEEEED